MPNDGKAENAASSLILLSDKAPGSSIGIGRYIELFDEVEPLLHVTFMAPRYLNAAVCIGIEVVLII